MQTIFYMDVHKLANITNGIRFCSLSFHLDFPSLHADLISKFVLPTCFAFAYAWKWHIDMFQSIVSINCSAITRFDNYSVVVMRPVSFWLALCMLCVRVCNIFRFVSPLFFPYGLHIYVYVDFSLCIWEENKKKTTPNSRIPMRRHH